MSLTARSPYHSIYQALLKQKYELAVSHEVLLEYEEILNQKYGAATTDRFLNLLHLLPNVHFISTYFHWNLIEKDEDDNKFVDTAIAAGSDYLVTEDTDFDVIKRINFPKLAVIKIDDFVALLSKLPS
ncbi:MAG: putative toxin-antitoxin system toxin component, PIN family [Saprospiraceae bacterium]